MIVTNSWKLKLAVCLTVLFSAVAMNANCNQTTASQADKDLWNTHGCWQDFFSWQYQAYDMRGSDWGSRGWSDACNVNKEYPKHWNASYLLTYGLQDNWQFYFHGIGAYAFGAMWENNGTASRFHSPNQVQVEFLCDVADYPQSWVPNSVRLAAKSDANTRASTRFINGPGYFCGDPRPW